MPQIRVSRPRVQRQAALVAAAAVGLAAVLLPMVSASAAGATVTPIAGNASCKTLLGDSKAFEIKVESGAIANGATFGPVTFAGVNGGKSLMGFTSTEPIKAVFVKGGTGGGGALYSYAGAGSASDTDMGVVDYGNGGQQISHVSFCWPGAPVVPLGLQASKTAVATHQRDVSWELTKSVSDDAHTGQAGQVAGTSTWDVDATKTVQETFTVTGTITVSSPNVAPVLVTVTDTLDDGTPATVTCPGGGNTGSVAAGQNLVCTYTASPTSDDATINNATIATPVGSGVPGTTAEALVDWSVTTTGDDTVQMTDQRLEYDEPISETTPLALPEEFECPSDPGLYDDGEYSSTETNLATLTGASTDLEADADVLVTCELPALTATKTAGGTYDRVITWDLDKTVAPAGLSGTAGGPAGTASWTLEITKDVAEIGHEVTGVITVGNSAAIAQTFSVSDVLDDDTVADVDCDTTSPEPGLWTVEAGETVFCTYTALTATATNNIATVTAPGNAPVEAEAAVLYTGTTVGDETVTLADPDLDYSAPFSDSDSVVLDEPMSCPSDASAYTNGVNDRIEANTATLTGENTDLSADATVPVGCTLAPLTASKTADATFTRDIEWELEKSVDDAAHQGQAGDDAGSSEWTLTATKTVVEGGNLVTGTITVENPSGIDVPVTVTDVLNDGTVATVDCPGGDVEALDDAVGEPGLVPAGGTLVCTYAASPATRTASLNTATVAPVGNAPVFGTADVDFVGLVTGDESVQLDDPSLGHSSTLEDSGTVELPQDFACSDDPADYVDGAWTETVTNTATLTGDSTDETATAGVEVDCVLPPLTAAKTAQGSFDRVVSWGLTKSVDDDEHVGEPGQDAGSSTWTVTATKTTEELDHVVDGAITVGNPSLVARTFTVGDELSDGTEVVVDCPKLALQPGESVNCTYTAESAEAEENVAVVTSAGNGPVEARASIDYEGTTIGDDSVVLADPRLDRSETVSETTTLELPETFTCPSDPDVYVDGSNDRTETNTATLTGDTTSLSSSADVDVECIRTEVRPSTLTPSPTPRVLPFVADPPAPEQPRVLPFTGAWLLPLLALGVGATLIGSLLTGAARRRGQQ